MQEIVTVASQSPPVVMTSTTPAAQAAQAPGQEPFELVLKKTSERINEDRYEGVNQGSEQKSLEKQNDTSSTTNKSLSVTKEKKEVNKTNLAEKEEKIKQKDEKNEDSNGFSSVALVPIENIPLPQQTVVPMEEIPVESSDVTEEELKVVNVTTMTAISINQVTETQVAKIVNDVVTTGSEKQNSQVALSLSDQSNMSSSSSLTTSVENTETSEGQNTSTSTLDIEVKPVVDQKLKSENDEKSNTVLEENVALNAKDIKNSKIEMQPKVQVTTTQAAEKTVIESKADIPKDTAPPDTPKVNESPVTSSTVTTSQINEPARLAEAPRNEVVSQVASQIDQMVKTNRSTLHLQLYPEELGHIDLKIVTTKSGIGVTMIADSASTQEILRSEMNSLKQNMQQAGIQLSNLNIGQGQNSNKQQQFEDQQAFVNSTYQSNNVSGSKPFETEKKVQLQTSVIDYRV